MKLKNLNSSLFILAGLLFLSLSFFAVAKDSSDKGNIFLDSDQDGLTDEEEKIYGTNPHNPDTDNDGYSDGAEVQSGYDPLKMAPGDKLVVQAEKKDQFGGKNNNDKPNMTEELARKIVDINNGESGESGNGMVLSELQSMIDEAMGAEEPEETEEVSSADIKIIKQNYDGLSEEKAKERRKEDMIKYISVVAYVMASNSPEPITSSTDVNLVVEKLTQKIINSLSAQNSDSLDDLSASGKKAFEQLKEVEVPEDLTDIHLKALNYFKQSENLKELIDINPEDPMRDLVNYSKIASFISSSSSFYEEVQAKVEEYGISDEEFDAGMKSYGLDLDK